MRLIIIILILFTNSCVNAQTIAASDRIATQIGQMIIRLEQQQDQINDLQVKLQHQQAEVKRLKDKHEPENKESK